MTDLIYALTNKGHARDVIENGSIKNILMSYWFLRKNPLGVLDYIRKFNIEIFMLDSGAFSAWKNGKNVFLWDYIDFVKNYHHYFTHIVCLDVIDNPILSEVNHLIMLDELKDFNLVIIPVFHSGEPFAVLDYMIERGYKYIGISPNNNWGEEDKRKWLTRIFVRHDFEKLGIKTHGFGYQSFNGLSYFPMTTADSRTWTVGKMYGEIIDGDGKRILYSDWGRGNQKHIDNISGGHSEFVINLCGILGIEIDELRTNWRARDRFNIEALRVISQRVNGNVFYQDNLFENENNGDFSEEKIISLYNEAKLLGRQYKGSPLSDNGNKTLKKKVKLEKQNFGVLF